LFFFFAGHYRFNNTNQIMKSSATSTVSITGDVSFSAWIKRDVTWFDQFPINVGNNPSTNGMLTIGYRWTNTFTFAFWSNDLDTPIQTEVSTWVHW
jgi:hypothetical protein